MPLEMRPMTAADVPAFAIVAHEALGHTGMGLACHSHIAHPAYLAHRQRRVLKALQNPRATVLKVVDTDDGDRLVAGAHWEALDAGRDDDELAKLLETYDVIPEEEERHGQAQRDFFGWLYSTRVRRMGKTPHHSKVSLPRRPLLTPSRSSPPPRHAPRPPGPRRRQAAAAMGAGARRRGRPARLH